jgi:hypothetical protein
VTYLKVHPHPQSRTGHTAMAHGSVTGVFLMVGGPAGESLPLTGRVIASDVTTGKRFRVSTGRTGRFTMVLPPGIYNLTGYSPRVLSNGQEMRCTAARPVRVKAGKRSRSVDVFCSVR